MITIRKQDWEEKLKAYIKDVGLRGFKYGHHDCVQFSAGAFKAMTGLDPLKGIAKYKTVREVSDLLEDMGGLFAATDTMLSQLPVESKPPTQAITGDIVGFYNQDDDETVGVVYDMGSIAVVGKKGLQFIALHPTAVRCWSV